MYRVELRPAAVRDLERLEASRRRRVVAAIRDLASDPRPPGCRKLAGAVDLWRTRVGDHRIVYQIRDDLEVVIVIRIRHRRDVYRGL